MIPKFFRLMASGTTAASVRKSRTEQSVPCQKCGRAEETVHSPVEAEVKAGKNWPDLLPSACASFVSKRVADGLTRLNAQCTFESAVIVAKGNSPAAPEYFLMHCAPGLDLDLESSRCDGLKVCAACGALLQGGLNCERLVPIESSWNGSAMFSLRKPRMPQFLNCTIDVLELARTEKWRNLHFRALDMPSKLFAASGYKSIDYLGKQWPPTSWYPQRPSEGRSPKAWLEMYNSVGKGGEWYDAWQALLDLGEEILPLAIKQFERSDETNRLKAARLIVALHKTAKVPVAAHILNAATELWPEPSLHPTSV